VNVLVPQQVESVPIDQLAAHPRNPRQGDIGAIIQSLRANGLYRPLYVQKSSNYILAGTHTWRAMKAEGYKVAPVVWLDVDDERALRILLADNRIADLGSYDAGSLEGLLTDLSLTESSLTGTGYDKDDLQRMIQAANTPLKFNEHKCCRSDPLPS
jgi:ParB-like chromosome segregation protein Spo0J